MNGQDNRSSFDIDYFTSACVGVGVRVCSFLEVGKEFHGDYLDVVNFILFFGCSYYEYRGCFEIH